MRIPEKGMKRAEIMSSLQSYKEHDLDWASGKAMGYVYHARQDAMEVLNEAYTMYLTETALDPTTCPSILRIENEIAGMLGAHLGGDKNVVGSFTSGGTESVLMAVLSARNRARDLHLEIKEPEIIVPFTAHACFHKAGHYLGVKVVTIPVDDETFKADVDAMRDAITENTIMLVGSAPGYAHGVVDPIPEIAALAQEKGLLCHTDACVGGIHLPYMRKLGMETPEFDFNVPGVTSISVDLHKFGYAAKNASMIFYRDKSIRRYQIFACSGWPGYTIVNPVLGSSRTGGAMAAAWAMLHYMGDEGYMNIVREVMAATKILVDGIKEISELKINGSPDMCLFSFHSVSDRLNVYKLADELKERGGWHLQPQFARQNSKSNLHCLMTWMSVPHAEALLQDIKETVAELVTQDPPQAGGLAMAMQNMQLEKDEETVSMLLEMAGVTADETPGRMEEVNTVLEALPVDLVEFILTVYMNNIFKAG